MPVIRTTFDPQNTVLTVHKKEYGKRIDTIVVEAFEMPDPPEQKIYLKILRKKGETESFHMNDFLTLHDFRERFVEEYEFIPFKNYPVIEMQLFCETGDGLKQMATLPADRIKPFRMELVLDVF